MVQAAVGCDHCQSIRSDNLHCSEGGRPKKQRSNVLAPYWGLSLFTCSGTSWPHKFQLHHAIWNMSHFMARRTFRKFAMHYSCLENKLAGMWALPKTVFWTSCFFFCVVWLCDCETPQSREHPVIFFNKMSSSELNPKKLRKTKAELFAHEFVAETLIVYIWPILFLAARVFQTPLCFHK